MDVTYTYQSALGLDEGSILPVHLVVKTASVAQVVTGSISPPQGRRRCPAVDALATLFCSVSIELESKNKQKTKQKTPNLKSKNEM